MEIVCLTKRIEKTSEKDEKNMEKFDEFVDQIWKLIDLLKEQNFEVFLRFWLQKWRSNDENLCFSRFNNIFSLFRRI